MGNSRNWQNIVSEHILTHFPHNTIVLNPRRDDWDASWKQEATNPQFRQQVDWEQDGLATANTIIFNFEPKSLSPVTLMELGHELGKRPEDRSDLYVICPEDYWRKGNVVIMCEDAGVPVFSSLEEFLTKFK